ncbi:MAG TPA: hypothetical protein VKB75_07245, partial [Jatrophihabitans sp.]|nr:hypothetical protein [Jatrophihabitans sp.]
MRLDTKQAKRTLRAPARYGLILLAVAICAAGATADHLRPAQAGPAPKAAAIAHAKTPGGVDKDAFGSPEPQRATTGPGYTFLQANLNAQTPAGFQVWVSPRAAHHATIAKNAAAAVRDLRKLGVQIRWRGDGAPPNGEGLIVLREGRKGCGSSTSVIGMTWTYSHALPSGERYASGAGVWLCPRLF